MRVFILNKYLFFTAQYFWHIFSGKSTRRSEKVSILSKIIWKKEQNQKNIKGTKSTTKLVHDVGLISRNVSENQGRILTLLLEDTQVYRNIKLKSLLFKVAV
jgi:hypothetical protein